MREQVEARRAALGGDGPHPTTFNRLYIAMVEAGEAAGVLDNVLDRVAMQIEKEQKIKRRVRGAMIYPTVVLTFAILVLIGLLMFLVPVFVKVFDDLGGELPTLTQWVMHVSNASADYWFIIFPLSASRIFGFFRWKRTDTGPPGVGQLQARDPAVRSARSCRKVAMARWSRTLSTLIAAGVDIIRRSRSPRQTAGNWVVEEETGKMRIRVQEGATIAQPLIESAIFPPMVSQMVKIGEETGELEKMLGKVADFYEDEVDASIQALTSIIEPVMMIGVGLMVGIIVIAMYLPMFKSQPDRMNAAVGIVIERKLSGVLASP